MGALTNRNICDVGELLKLGFGVMHNAEHQDAGL
jgi:hypothetical protein